MYFNWLSFSFYHVLIYFIFFFHILFGNCLEIIGNPIYLFDLLRMVPSAQLLLVTRRKKLSGKYPVKIRIIYQRNNKDFPIGIDLTQEEFDGATAKHIKGLHREVSKKLNEKINKANKIIGEPGVFTFDKFSEAFNGRVKDSSNLYALFDDYIKILTDEERLKTAESYITAKNSFKDYKNNIGLYDITPGFLNNYQSYQRKRKISSNKVGLSDTTIGIYVRTLRSIYNYAISLGIIKRDESYPFGKRKFVIPASRNIKKALSIQEVSKIYNYQTIPGTAEDKARDFWIFSYLCNGINFKDVSLLQNKNIDGDMLRFVRAKTKNTTRANQTTISCHLGDAAKSIIEKWRNHNREGDGYLFAILQVDDDARQQVRRVAQFIKNTNKYMKRISHTIGIEMVANTGHTRHSSATILKRSGASIEQIQEALGHLNSTTTRAYLDSFDDESKKELSNSLSNFV